MSYQFEEEKSQFVVKDAEGNEVGELTFVEASNNVIVINHTGVREVHRGQGLAEQLVDKVVQKAKKENLQIVPLCPFAKKQFDEKIEYQAVLHQ